MLSPLPPQMKVYLYTGVCDMRRSFDGLGMMVEQLLGREVFSGDLFVFRNRRGDRVKILQWDRTGYVIWYKRLEAGIFRFPESDGDQVEIESAELGLMLEGIDLSGAKRQKRYRRPAG